MDVLECDECSSVFSDASNLRRHKRTFHSTEKTFQCEHCEMKFKRPDHLKRHLSCHDKKPEKKACGVNGCKKVFIDLDKLEVHRAVHVKKSEEDLIIIKGHSVSKIMKEGSLSFLCPFNNCDRSYESYAGIVKHINIHLDPEMKKELRLRSKVYSCEKCDRAFDKKTRLTKHIEKVHRETSASQPGGTGDTKTVGNRVFFVCPYEGCRKIYTTVSLKATNGNTQRSNLKMHDGVVHRKVVLKCDTCGSSFKWKKSLKRHSCKAGHSL